MRLTYLVADDDPVSRRMINQIIEDEDLGEVIDMVEDGVEAEHKAHSLQPDIVVLDLLMPGQDGIETMRRLNERGYQGKFVMISQVENKKMVEVAYMTGAVFFIHKPINRVEVRTVLGQVRDTVKIKDSLKKIKQSLAHLESLEERNEKIKDEHDSLSKVVQGILSELGILGESGTKDLIKIMNYLYRKKIRSDSQFPTIKEIYHEVAALSGQSPMEIAKEAKAMEQRIRRVINHAISNLASLGLSDYTHPKFEYYASKFFDFPEVHKRMKQLGNGDSSHDKVKINAKKFIQVLFWETTDR